MTLGDTTADCVCIALSRYTVGISLRQGINADGAVLAPARTVIAGKGAQPRRGAAGMVNAGQGNGGHWCCLGTLACAARSRRTVPARRLATCPKLPGIYRQVTLAPRGTLHVVWQQEQGWQGTRVAAGVWGPLYHHCRSTANRPLRSPSCSFAHASSAAAGGSRGLVRLRLFETHDSRPRMCTCCTVCGVAPWWHRYAAAMGPVTQAPGRLPVLAQREGHYIRQLCGPPHICYGSRAREWTAPRIRSGKRVSGQQVGTWRDGEGWGGHPIALAHTV